MHEYGRRRPRDTRHGDAVDGLYPRPESLFKEEQGAREPSHRCRRCHGQTSSGNVETARPLRPRTAPRRVRAVEPTPQPAEGRTIKEGRLCYSKRTEAAGAQCARGLRGTSRCGLPEPAQGNLSRVPEGLPVDLPSLVVYQVRLLDNKTYTYQCRWFFFLRSLLFLFCLFNMRG